MGRQRPRYAASTRSTSRDSTGWNRRAVCWRTLMQRRQWSRSHSEFYSGSSDEYLQTAVEVEQFELDDLRVAAASRWRSLPESSRFARRFSSGRHVSFSTRICGLSSITRCRFRRRSSRRCSVSAASVAVISGGARASPAPASSASLDSLRSRRRGTTDRRTSRLLSFEAD